MLQQKSAITKAEDLVLIHDIKISKPINIKSELQAYVVQQDLEYKMLKWEALRLVGKANEYAFKTELRYRKEFKKLPDHIQYEAREKFFKENIMHMSDEKADLLAEILEDIVNKKINKN
jgi:hypothetical protein